ncbi:MAG: methyltransferase domain-containing protein [Actinomycetes bacterium]
MDAAFLDTLRCPFCRVAVARTDDTLICPSCKRSYPIERGIPLMLHRDLPGAAEKLGEMAGWVEKARAEGWYEPDDHIDSHLPYLVRDLGWEDATWLANGHSFTVLLDDYIGDRRGLRVLEVGAAKAWAAPYWRERGCDYVATDILVDEKIGLGRGAFYGDFGRVQADGEHLPFADGTFDVTYCCATLHHALDLPAMVAEMSRVTKPGGVVAGLNEGTKGVGRSSDNPGQSAEKELGINEHVHTIWAYVAAFVRSGLVIRRMERSDGWPPGRLGSKIARLPKIGQTLGTLLHLSAGEYSGVTIYARKRG